MLGLGQSFGLFGSSVLGRRGRVEMKDGFLKFGAYGDFGICWGVWGVTEVLVVSLGCLGC